MPTYTYKALSASGKSISGTLEAGDRKQVLRKLKAMRARPVSVDEVRGKAGKGGKAATDTAVMEVPTPRDDEDAGSRPGRSIKLPSIKGKESVGLAFLKRLLDLHSSGMPLGDSVRLLQQRLSDPQLQGLAQALWRELSEGRPLAEAMRTQPDYFDESISYVIEAGEATGSVAPILERIIAHLEEKQAIRGKVLSGLSYPFLLVTAATGVALYLVFDLLPRIRGMLESLGGEINWSMWLLIEGSSLFLNFGPFAVVAALLIGIGFFQWRRTEKGRFVTDAWLIRIPLFGRILVDSDLFQLSSLIATLAESGINMTETLRLTERTISNRYLRARFRAARVQINEGMALSQALRRNRIMPDLALDILSVGENTGNVANGLKEISKSFRRELDQRMKFLVTAVTSGALALAFGMVALVAYGMVSSVFQVSRTLSLG